MPIQLVERTTFSNFLAGENRAAITCLKEVAEHYSEAQVLLWGKGARGKTHLLQALCHHASSLGLRPAYLPLAEVLYTAPEMLEGMERMDLVCVDDVDAVAGQMVWEEALFGLINACRQARCPLVFSSSLPPSDAGFSLPDLQSRLMWGPVFQLRALDDEQLKASLRQRAEARGLDMEEAVIRFMLERMPRDYASLIDSIDRLDAEALAQQRRITVPLVKEVLGI